MGGLFDALNAARTTLEAGQAGVQVTGHNISNANTEGFHRRRVNLSAVSPAPEAGGVIRVGGVEVHGTTRATNELLAKQVVLSAGAEAKAQARQGLLLQVEQAAASIGSNGISGAISSLMSKLSALSTSPADSTVRQEVIASAKTLSEVFNQASTDLNHIRQGADSSVKVTIDEINTKTAKIAALNAQIQAAEAGGQVAGDLRDNQEQLLADLAKLTGATGFTDASGMLSVMVGSSVLVQGRTQLKLKATASTALSGMYRVDLVTGSSSAVNITSRITSGKLGGLIDVRDSFIPKTSTRLDSLAHDIATNINTQHQAGFGLDGLGSRSLFTVAATSTGYAASMALHSTASANALAASSTAIGVPGNNVNALALAALRNADLAATSSATFNEEAASMAGAVGLEVANANSAVLVKKDELTYMKKLEQAAVGVSLDEEMVQLIQFQRTYQAGVRVLQVVDKLLGEVMSLKQ